MRSRQPVPRIAWTAVLSSLRIASVSALAASSAVAKCRCLSAYAWHMPDGPATRRTTSAKRFRNLLNADLL
jgi:hypothetical protein